MPLIETKGAASAQGFGEFATSAEKLYIESCFSTYLYTGNGSTQTITNGIDLSTKGGMLWDQSRSNAYGGAIYDSARGVSNRLFTFSSNAQSTSVTDVTSFNNNGFTLSGNTQVNGSAGQTYVSWTFRKQPKFFDVVTYTGNGSTLSVNHALASKPGCIIIKRTDSTSDWLVCTRKSTGNIYAMYLNTTAGQFYDGTEGSLWTSTAVSINWINSNVAAGFNTNGATYVMYLFAHDAGGFGLSGTDNVISCGSFTSSSVGYAEVNLGYEPQFYLRKQVDSAANWQIVDNMRGFTVTESKYLYPNTSGAEGSTGSSASPIRPTATGFIDATLANDATYIYIAIRRGPMKVPTSGTSVFSPVTRSGTATTYSVTSGFAPDSVWMDARSNAKGALFFERLRGLSQYLQPSSTGAEGTNAGYITQMGNIGYTSGADLFMNTSGETYVDWLFRRAPGFFDVVCYTGTGSATTFSHNLGVVPELMIVKKRNVGDEWAVYSSATGNTKYLVLNTTVASATSSSRWDNTSPTSSVFTVGLDSSVNSSGGTYVAYLFATVAGVSKVGSYTGSGTTKQIDCGFTGGARFVLIKRTDSTGDWYVYDTARGIVAGNDSYLFLNSTAAEVTSTDYVDTYSAGFELSSTAPAGLNANGGTYIFLAIA
jgi:hypothetical protein